MQHAQQKSAKWDVYAFIAFFSVLATASIYRFGQSNHGIIIPFLKNTLNRELYPADYLIGEQDNYFTLLWPAVSYIVDFFGLEISTLFFVIYLLSIGFAMWGIYLFCMLLFNRAEVAYLTMFLIVFAFINNPGIGGDYILESRLKESVAALPFFSFALYFFFKKDYLKSYILQGLAFLIHPLSAIHLMAVLFLSFIIKYKEIGAKTFFTSLFWMLVIISPLLYIKFTGPSGPGLFYADPHWVEIIKIRQPEHVFPTLMSGWRYLKALILIALFFISWKHKPSDEFHSVIKISLLAILALWIVGAIFGEFLPLAIIVQLQFFRSYIILTFFAIVYFSNYFMVEMSSSNNLIKKLVLAALMLLFIYNFPKWNNKYLYFVALGVLLISYPVVLKKNISLAIFKAIILLFLGSFVVYGFVNNRPFTIGVMQEKEWIDAQNWARLNSNPKDIFIVPPAIEGFRILSERSIYGDWKDGQQAYFNPEFGFIWEKRMNSLGMNDLYECKENSQVLVDNFKLLSTENISDIGQQIRLQGHKVFLVTYNDVETVNLPEVYHNANFTVYLVQ